MTKAATKNVGRAIVQKRRELVAIRAEIEDLLDYLEVLEARARDTGKPRLSHEQVKKRYAAASARSNARNGRKAA
jgi:hypothetical protein